MTGPAQHAYARCRTDAAGPGDYGAGEAPGALLTERLTVLRHALATHHSIAASNGHSLSHESSSKYSNLAATDGLNRMMQSGRSGKEHDLACGAGASSEVFEVMVIDDDGFMASARP